MKKFCIFAAIIAVVSCFAFTNKPSEITVPESISNKIIQIAVDNHCITSEDAIILEKTNAIQQCMDAFVSNSFDASAAIDKMAEIAVENGKYADKDAAKRAMRKNLDKARKNESMWNNLCSLLGL